MGTGLTFTKKKKKKKIPIERPYSQTQGRVMANEQFFKSSLKYLTLLNLMLSGKKLVKVQDEEL